MVSLKFFALASLCASMISAHPIANTKHRRAAARKCKAPHATRTGTKTAVLAGATTAASTHQAKPTPTGSASNDDDNKDEDDDKDDDKDEDKDDDNSPSGSGKLSALFPISFDEDDSWSTSANAQNVVPLSDSTFKPKARLSGISNNNYVTFAGKKALKAHYPKGSFNPSHEPRGGLSFYAPGLVDLTKAKEATFGYSVYFPAGFSFNLGGKLPGFYGGDNEQTALSCSGGRRSDECFSARLMWREKGQGEFYTYLPPFTDSRYSANKKQCSVVKNSDCNPTYGASIGRGLFKFATGGWTTVSERVRLNDVGQANGELELFVNGKSKILLKGLILRAHSAGRIRGIQMQTFFGGSNSDWATPRDQDVYFADFSVAITKHL